MELLNSIPTLLSLLSVVVGYIGNLNKTKAAENRYVDNLLAELEALRHENELLRRRLYGDDERGQSHGGGGSGYQ